MNIAENIRLAISGLKSNKMRAFLTMLGIIIGVGSVIAIVTVGNSLTLGVNDSMSALGANNIQIGIYQKDDAEREAIDDKDKISNEHIEKLKRRFGDKIAAITYYESMGYGQAKEGRRYANASLFGASEGYFDAQNKELLSGRYITEKDVKGAKPVAMVTDKFAKNLFGEHVNPIGREIKIYTSESIYVFTIIGVYKYEPMPMMPSMESEKDLTTEVIIPVTTVQRLKGKTAAYTSIVVTSSDDYSAEKLSRELEEFFEKEYEKNPRYGVYSYSMESMLEQMNQIMGTISIAVAIIAGISLLVGGIGVMNIMLVSVTERTREIGTRKALGAPNSAIRTQFIVEAMIICLIGGVLGIALGLVLGVVGSNLMKFPASPNVAIIVIAVLFSMCIGVFFGYYPANKAAKLDPIEALRYE